MPREASSPSANADDAHLPPACTGECRDCGRAHALPHGNARAHARALMAELEAHRRLDFPVPEHAADPMLSFDRVFADGKGNMFGVLECRDEGGGTVVLRAFSSLPWGTRDVEGWVPPLLSTEVFDGVVAPGRREIEQMTRALEALDRESAAHAELLSRRKQRSRALLRQMHELYALRNFRGETRRLREAFDRPQGIPGGVGECCAPKLLHHAASHGLWPVGLAEFYWGGQRGARGREQGRFYSPCATRCEPILGFLLCGLEERGIDRSSVERSRR